jgi:fibronectin type 3 domain-containing protein
MKKIKDRLLLVLASLVLATSGAFGFLSHVAFASGFENVSGSLTDINGNPLSNWQVTLFPDGSSQAAYGGIENGGEYFVPNVADGVYDFEFTIGNENFWVNNQDIEGTSVVNGSTDFATGLFSGILKDSSNDVFPGENVWLNPSTSGWEPQAKTNSSGQFSVRGRTDTAYDLQIDTPTGTSSPIDSIDFATHNHPIDFSNGDINQDLVFQLRAITISLKDYNNNPVANDAVVAQPGNWDATESNTTVASGISGSFGASSHAYTDANGNATLYVIDGSWFGQRWVGDSPYYLDNICATNTLDQTGLRVCMHQKDFYVTSDMSVLLQPISLAPTNLTGPDDAQVPHLTWTGSTGATSYNIYRSDVLAGTSTTASFDDTTAPQGQYDYHVTAVKNGLESDPSNTIYTYVDHTAPTISLSTTPTVPASGWFTSNVTVNFTCADDVYLTTCPTAVNLTSDTTGQTVSGTAVDRAGNTASTSTVIKIDKVAPTISSVTLSLTTTIRTGNTLSITANTSDATSGVGYAEYYIDTDPGTGAATPMTLNGTQTQATASPTISGLSNGTHTVYVRIKDNAGHWSTISSATFSFKK